MITLRKSAERGYADHGWLKSFHSFSFADYYDPRAHGLRQPARHQRGPHRARAPASARTATATWRSSATCSTGELAHKDSMGNGGASGIIRPGDVQRMSAGRGVHAQRVQPRARTQTTHFLQIWIEPNVRGIAPGYEQKRFADAEQARPAAPGGLARRRRGLGDAPCRCGAVRRPVRRRRAAELALDPRAQGLRARRARQLDGQRPARSRPAMPRCWTRSRR